MFGVDTQSQVDEKKPKDSTEDDEASASRYALVKEWQEKIHKAKKKYSEDFDRMRKNMDFVYGLQHPGQKKLIYEKNVINLTLRAVNQGVASLYAKDPKVTAKRRPRFDFAIWDGNMESIMTAVQQAGMMQMSGMMPPPEVMALLQDYQEGKQKQKLIEKVGKTLEMVYQYQTDTASPCYKTQMKQLVRRIRVCGVGYQKITFCRDYESENPTNTPRLDSQNRIKEAKRLLEKMQEGKVDDNSPEVEQLKNLVDSLQPEPMDSEVTRVKERIDFDFPQATAVIPDPNTRSLKGWVGTHWITEEFCYPLDFVNAFYEVKIQPDDLKAYDPLGQPIPTSTPEGDQAKDKKRKVRVWVTRDIDTKSEFTMVEGYKDFIVQPEQVDSIDGFWNIFPYTFNDIEVEEGCSAAIFPPSDVDLMRSTQRDWNDCRYKLKRHRRANGPRYLYPDGSIDEEDLDRLESSEDQGFVKLKSLAPGAEPSKIVQALQTVDIKSELYDTEPQREDMLLVTGQQEANIGPAQPNVTATIGAIAEQSRMNVTASDSDGFDDTMTEAAKFTGKLLLRNMSKETVIEITGNGVWPETDKQMFLNEIELEIVAASSGRPNKAVEINNWSKIVPLILQAATLPPQAQPTMQAVIRETLKRDDERIEPSDFFPLPMPMLPTQPEQGQQPQPQGKQQGKRPNTTPRKDSSNNGQQQMYPVVGG